MKKLRGLWSTAFFILAMCTTSLVYAAGTISYSVNVSGLVTPWTAAPALSLSGNHLDGSVIGALPYFDPSIGTLQYVTIGSHTTYVLGSAVSDVPHSYGDYAGRWDMGDPHSIKGLSYSSGTVTVTPGVLDAPFSYYPDASITQSPFITYAEKYGTAQPPESGVTIMGNPFYNTAYTGYWAADAWGDGFGSEAFDNLMQVEQFIGSGSFQIVVSPELDAIFTQNYGPSGAYDFTTFCAMFANEITITYQYATLSDLIIAPLPYQPPWGNDNPPPPPTLIPPVGGSTPSVNDPNFWSYYFPAAPVPEPCTLLLLTAGLFGLVGFRRKLGL